MNTRFSGALGLAKPIAFWFRGDDIGPMSGQSIRWRAQFHNCQFAPMRSLARHQGCRPMASLGRDRPMRFVQNW